MAVATLPVKSQTGFTQIKQMDGCGGELAGFISFYITSSIWPLYAFVHFLSCGFV